MTMKEGYDSVSLQRYSERHREFDPETGRIEDSRMS